MSERLEIKAALEVSDAGEITGTAWPFSGPDRVGDLIQKGAFTAPDKLPMLWSHDQAEVVGVWDQIEESAEGLTVKGKLLVESVERAREVHAMIKAGAVSGLSIGFVTKQAQRHGKGRTITALDLREVSIVAIPSHPDAQITSVKSTSNQENFVVENEEATPEVKDEVETKAEAPANDAPGIDMKTFDAMKARLEKLEAKSAIKAPAVIQGDFEQKSAFIEYLQTGVETKALSTANDTANHVLAPEEVSAEFLRNLVEYSPIRAIADVRQTASASLVLPKRTGVTNAAWVGETATRTGSQPTFGQMKLSVNEIATYVDISLQLVEDSANVLSEVNLALAEDFGQKEALAFVEGVAANDEPAGFMTDANIDTLAAVSATDIDPDELIALMYSMPATYRNAGTWVMNGSTLAAIRTLKDGHGNYLWQPSYQAGQPETILGRPVIEAIDMPDVATTEAPIIFGDFKRGYRIYDRVSLAMLADPYSVRVNGLMRYHARRRVGAGVVRPDAFKKLVMAAA
ncbi:phage major capsid protein [Paracoccus saliphilus]|uniref:Phage major capsid protein n=1 Tax=Paracoccus saliphilus TaxID=405559 RepID=A0AA45W7N1_9RHOB|nr:phage major capsid protein [Paracoccus saliphilus]WCR04760.1 phage major capsid protein [Paracoccus saliphilus]SIT11019.1 phage prohead protease, HK97 family/phage major capsid protein, HK97 family,TIGR01554 [Paracoccus saliphilus]